MKQTKLIQLSDDSLVEIEITSEDVEEISWRKATKVDTQLGDVVPLIKTISKSLYAAWGEVSKDFLIEKAEVEIGIGFEGEGNIYITKAKANANLGIKLILSPRPPKRRSKK